MFNLAGASLEQADVCGLTPLHLASLNKLTATVELLLAGGKDWKALTNVDCRDHEDRTPVHAAAFAKSKELLELLIKNKADVTAIDAEGRSAIHWVLTRDKDRPRATSAADAIECIEYLQSVGADIKALDKYGRSAIHYAAYHNLPSCCVFLLRAGLDPNLQDKRYSLSLSLSLSLSPLSPLFPCKVHLCDDIDWFRGYTSLHCSVINESDECTSILLKGGASQRIASLDGITPISLACAHCLYKNIVLLCEDAQFSPDDKVRNNQPLSAQQRDPATNWSRAIG